MITTYFSDQLTPSEDRDRLMLYAGMFLAFQDIFGSYGVGNQSQAKDYNPAEPQYLSFVIYSETDPMPDTGFFIDVFPDGSAVVSCITSYPDPGRNERIVDCEKYESNVTDLIKWLRTQPPKLHSFLGDLI